MAESTDHITLVNNIQDWFKEKFKASEWLVYIDSSGDYGRKIKISCYVPDFYAKNLKNNDIIVGEAKTSGDLETVRSKKQIQNFINYCIDKNAFFVLAVPWHATVTAKRIVELMSKGKLKNKYCILDYLEGR